MPTHFFGDSWEFPYELTVEHTYFFGLCKKVKKMTYTVSMFQQIKDFHDHWDNLIKSKKPLK